VADGFTKALPTRNFEECKHNLNPKQRCDWGEVLAIQICVQVHRDRKAEPFPDFM
jgi:hypothetical protein